MAQSGIGKGGTVIRPTTSVPGGFLPFRDRKSKLPVPNDEFYAPVFTQDITFCD
ncbi:MAG: hypothetical protein U0936_27320 [Planctomycetaceae bacterium]